MAVRAGAPRPASHIVYGDGAVRRGPIGADEQVALWARCLHVGRPGLVELVAAGRHADGRLRMRSRKGPEGYSDAGDVDALVEGARRHRAAGGEVFCTPLTRRWRRPGRSGGVLPGSVAWIDIDDAGAVERLRAFVHRPQLVVRSGSGGAHAYWRLAEPLEPEEIEALNRKLAGHLGGDLGSCDQARIMRLPGSWNAYAGKRSRLSYCDLATPAIVPAELADGLPDPKPPASQPAAGRRKRPPLARELDDAAAVPPPHYFRALAGVEVPDRGGHICCPLPDHEEWLPSCMVYASPEEGWWCFGCVRGGSIYDFASLLECGPWGRGLRDDRFREVKRGVYERLGLASDGPPPGAPARPPTEPRPEGGR